MLERQPHQGQFARGAATLLLMAFSTDLLAAPAVTTQDIPQTPSAPPKLSLPASANPFSCQRAYVYKGKALDCDSNVQRDAEKLRPIIKDVPAAVNELNLYQRNRRTLVNAAYLSSLGLAIALAGFAISRPPVLLRFPLGETTINAGGYLVLGGLGLTVGGFTYGLGLSRTNEAHLGNAVQEFNRARPETPIELQFKTDFNL